MQAVPLPPPYGGKDDKTPPIALQPPFAETVYNFVNHPSGVSLRNGHSKFSNFSQAVGGTIAERVVAVGDTSISILVCYDTATGKYQFWNGSTGAVLHTTAAVALGSGNPWGFLYFNGYLLMFSSDTVLQPGFSYNVGTGAVAVLGYTGLTFPTGACSYKNRVYVFPVAGTNYWYGGIDAIAGAMTSVSLATVATQAGYITAICPITISDTIAAETFLTFIFSNGDVLFYSGSYPNAADWKLAGRAKIAPPLSSNSYIEYQGDSLILCENGVVSLRDLFLKGSEQAQSLTVNTRIQAEWTKLVTAIRAVTGYSSGPVNNVFGVWNKKTNRIEICFPYYLDTSGVAQQGNYFFVYDTIEQAWFTQRTEVVSSGTGIRIKDLAYFQGKVLMLAQNTKIMLYQKEGATGFTDRNINDDAEVTYSYEILSSPVSGGRANVQKMEGMDVIVKSDMHDVTNYQFVGDFGVQTTTAQKVNAVSGSLQKPYVNMGIEGSYVQYKISGTTTTGKTVGYQLYGVNVWTSQGTSPR